MAEDLNSSNEDVVTNQADENDGGSLESVVVDSELVNGQLQPDQTEVSQQANVNSRNQ